MRTVVWVHFSKRHPVQKDAKWFCQENWTLWTEEVYSKRLSLKPRKLNQLQSVKAGNGPTPKCAPKENKNQDSDGGPEGLPKFFAYSTYRIIQWRAKMTAYPWSRRVWVCPAELQYLSLVSSSQERGTGSKIGLNTIEFKSIWLFFLN